MSFRDIIGQESAVRIINEQLLQQRINHAYLFTGKAGVGKKLLAFKFAMALNCQNYTEIQDVCDNCICCQKIKHHNHSDVSLIEPEDKGKTIKIDQIRNFQKDIVYKPYESQYKIYIIDEADHMTPEAANSLLKTLEEPPEYAVIILLAEEISNLLLTVVSRCQQISLKTISQEIIKDFLLKKDITEEKADLYSRLAGGSIGKSLELIGDNDYLNNRDTVLKFLQELSDINKVEIFDACKNMVGLLDAGFPLFDLILNWYRDIIIYNQGNIKQITNADFLKGMKAQVNIYNIDEISGVMDLIYKTKSYIERNVRKDLALEVMFFKIKNKKVFK